MRRVLFNTALVAIAAGGMLLASCGDHDMFNPNYKAEEYAANWETKFGKIDPNQDWSMATQKTVTVSVSKTSDVKIYTKGLDKSYLLAANVVSSTMDIVFDVRKGLTEVYVVATAGDDRDVRTVDITNETASADFTSSYKKAAKTRAGETALPERELVYAVGYNLVEGQKKDSWNRDYVNLINLNYDKTYNYSSWGSNIYASGMWATLQDQPAPETGATIDMTNLTDVQTGCSELYTKTDNDITKLYPFTQDYKMVTAKAQEITMTGIFRNTAGNTALLYYYTKPGASANELKAADKYVLIPNTQNIVGKEYKLIYYDPNNNYAPTYTFPANVEIHFALAINPSCMTKWVDANNGKDIIANVMSGGLISFSDEVLNTEIFKNVKSWTSMASSAVYTYNGVNIISFEDWGGQFTVNNGVPSVTDDNSIDWNDIAFAINADFQTPPPPVDKEQETGETWILACEDLGSTDDYDFNDIVLEARHKITYDDNHSYVGSDIQIRCLAAGGTLPANIYYNGDFKGEAHSLLGGETNQMINTYSFNGASEWITVEEGVSEDKNVVTAASVMKNISIEVVTQNEGQETKQQATTITCPDPGEALQMIILPGDWKWPAERKRIEEAYPEFKNWNADSNNISWYKTWVGNLVINH